MAVSEAKPDARKLHYGWVIFAVSFVALVISAGLRSGPSVLIVPIEEAFGWSRTTLSFAIALQLFIYGLVGPFSAAFIDRFGMRNVLIVALLLMALGFGMTLSVTTPWLLEASWGFAMGIGTGTAGGVMAAMIANRWFYAQRGMVLGLLTATTAAGQLIFLPLFANLVASFGLPVAVYSGCVIALVLVPIVWFTIRDFPADVGARPYGQPDDIAEPPPPVRANPFTATMASLGYAIVTRDFWLLSLSFLVCGLTTSGLIGTHFIPSCLDHGIVATTAAGILAAMGVLNFFGTSAAGWLTDRFDSRYLLFWFYFLRGIALSFLPYAFELPSWGLTLFGILYGLDWLATGPPTLKLTADSFGTNNAGMVYGWICVMHQVGAAIAAFGAGYLRVESGTYNTAYFISAALCLIGALAVLRVGKRPGNASPVPILAGAET